MGFDSARRSPPGIAASRELVAQCMQLAESCSISKSRLYFRESFSVSLSNRKCKEGQRKVSYPAQPARPHSPLRLRSLIQMFGSETYLRCPGVAPRPSILSNHLTLMAPRRDFEPPPA